MKQKSLFFCGAMTLLLLVSLFAACTDQQPTTQTQSQPPATKAMEPMEPVKDPHSFANTSEVVVEDLALDVNVDFDKKQIAGIAHLRINNKAKANRLILDTRDLTIQKVTLTKFETREEAETKFTLGDEVKYLGRSLTVEITPDTHSVNVSYSTSPQAAALQWLEPSQTAGGKKPFLFTQSQAILARTWAPCQDTPSVRMTYRARVKTRPDLLAVMSASNNPQINPAGVYEFEMKQAIPSYLLALAVGDIAFRPLGSRSGVYAEPSVVDRAANEFADLEKMITAAESLYGPYRWERYDVIVLPPSFPFGGMENPRLTFATPTILAGDRSLVSLIAHELAHSWSGNLVTNATWNDFWLNEGFTNYFENRIMEKVNGRNYSEMLAQLGLRGLKEEIESLKDKPEDTRLKLDLAGRDPDEGTTSIAYDKGFMFLRMMEEAVGREKWDEFLKKYFDSHAFQSMTTEGFVNYLRENLIKGDKALEARMKIDEWIYRPGLPDNCPNIQAAEFTKVEEQVKAWTDGKPARDLNITGWTTQHWLHFLSKLPEQIAKERMSDLDSAFGFTKSGNSEILSAWLMHAIKNKYETAYPALENFLTTQGRRKFLRPLYAEMVKTPEGKTMAKRIYAKARPTYHSVSYTAIDEVLK